MNGNILIMSILAVVQATYGHGSYVVGGDPGILHPIPAYTTTATRHGIISDSHHQFVDVNGIVHSDVGLNGIDGGYIGGIAGVNRIVHAGNIGVDGLIRHSASSGVVNVNGVVHAVAGGLDDGSYIHQTDGSYIHQADGIPLRSHINGHIVHPIGSTVTTLGGSVQHVVDDGSYVQHHQITAHGPASTSSSSSIVNVVPNVPLVSAGGFIRNDLGLIHGGHTIQTVSPAINIQHQAILHDTSDIVTSHIQDNGGNVVQHINSANENYQFSLPAASPAQQFFTTDGGFISGGGAIIGHGLVGEAGIIGHGLVGNGGVIGHGLVGGAGIIGHGIVGEGGVISHGLVGDGGVISHGLVGDGGVISHGIVGNGGIISHGIVGNNGIRYIGNAGAAGIVDHGLIGGGQVLLTSPQTAGISVQHHVTGDLTQAQLESLRLPSFQSSVLHQNLEGHTLITDTTTGGIVRGVGGVNFVQPAAIVRGGGVSGDQVLSVNIQENGVNTEQRIDSANEHFKFTVPTATSDDGLSPISGGASFGGVISGSAGGSVDGSFGGDFNLNANGGDKFQKGFNRYGAPNA